MRHVLGRVFSTFASSILRLPVYDSQCRAKLIKREMIHVAFAQPFLSSCFFDVEVLARLRNAFGVKRVTVGVLEMPLMHWGEGGGSKLAFRLLMRLPLGLLKISAKFNL